MWNREELLKQVEGYFKNTSKEQFLQDLEDIGCLHLIEEVREQVYFDANEDYKALLQIMDRAKKLAYLRQEEEEDKPRFRMDKQGNLTRIED